MGCPKEMKSAKNRRKSPWDSPLEWVPVPAVLVLVLVPAALAVLAPALAALPMIRRMIRDFRAAFK